MGCRTRSPRSNFQPSTAAGRNHSGGDGIFYLISNYHLQNAAKLKSTSFSSVQYRLEDIPKSRNSLAATAPMQHGVVSISFDPALRKPC
jgi:hypothetical protein